ncbi:MAG: alpha/beta hydrolase, partial [Chthoniobacterales bacterium]
MVLDTYASLNAVPLEKSTPEAVRKAPSLADAVKAVMKKEGKSAPFTGTTQDIKVPTAGGELAARVYIPAGDGPFPTIYYIHGGGWVIGDIDIYDSSPRALCEKTKAVVISTEYRKAPEHKYPAAHDDTWAVYQWVLQNAAKYKGDPKKVAIVGESAGGNMAASICIMAKQKGVQMPVHQLLIYPVTDYSFET